MSTSGPFLLPLAHFFFIDKIKNTKSQLLGTNVVTDVDFTCLAMCSFTRGESLSVFCKTSHV